MDHHFRVGASGFWEGDLDKYYYGRRANGIYVPRYRNIGADKREYVRGFGYQGGGSRDSWRRNVAELAFGADFKTGTDTIPGMDHGPGRVWRKLCPIRITGCIWIKPTGDEVGECRWWSSMPSCTTTKRRCASIWA